MSFVPFQDGITASWQFLDRLLYQHHVDIQRLWRALQDLGGSRSSFGTRDSDSYNISQQFERYARLHGPCHSGTPAVQATVQQYTVGSGYGDTTDPLQSAAIPVNGYFMGGYAFTDEIVRVRYDLPLQLWLVCDNGHHLVRGTLGAQLNNGGSASVTLARGGNVTGYEVLGISSPIAINKKVWLTWNKDTSHWEVVSAQC